MKASQVFFSASCGQTSRKAKESKEKTVQFHNHRPEIGFLGSNMGLGRWGCHRELIFPCVACGGSFTELLGGSLQPWAWPTVGPEVPLAVLLKDCGPGPPMGTSCRFTGVALCGFAAEGAKERGALGPYFSCPQTSPR